MQKHIIGLSLLLGMLITPPMYADPTPAGLSKPKQENPEKAEASKWMQVKLHSSQEILAGLTNADFKKIEDQSRRLLVFNLLETWLQNNPLSRESEYKGQLNSFEYATKELVRTSESKDIDGALNSYVLLTRSCVECHKLLRDAPRIP